MLALATANFQDEEEEEGEDWEPKLICSRLHPHYLSHESARNGSHTITLAKWRRWGTAKTFG